MTLSGEATCIRCFDSQMSEALKVQNTCIVTSHISALLAEAVLVLLYYDRVMSTVIGLLCSLVTSIRETIVTLA